MALPRGRICAELLRRFPLKGGSWLTIRCASVPLITRHTFTTAICQVLERTGFLDWMAGQANRRAHLEHVRALRDLLAASDAPDLSTWLADLHLGEVEAGPSDTKAVPLLTIHGVEGTRVAGRVYRRLRGGPAALRTPQRRKDSERDEERRLAYVALSRSQVQVYLTWCRTRLKDIDGQEPRRELRQPSRFVRALPPELILSIAAAQS